MRPPLVAVLLLALVGCEGLILQPGDVPDDRVPGDRVPGDSPGPGPDDRPDLGELPSPTCDTPGRGNAPTIARRLTREEYAATVEAALGVRVDRSLLAPEVRISGFTNDYGTLLPTQLVVRAQRDFGRVLAETLLAEGDPWLGRPPCAAAAARCVEDWVSAVGAPLFRRPVAADEATSFARLFSTLIDDGRSPEEAAAGTLRAMLLAPQTAYRVEAPNGDVATPDELASRLSFLVLGAGPDAPLVDAAASGALADPAARAQETRRLLAAGRGGAVVDELSYGWLHLDVLEGLTPTGNEDFDRELVEGAQALVRGVWLEDGGELRDVLTPTYVVPQSARAAERLGVAGAAPGERVDVTGDPRRAGLLTDPAVLSGTGADSFPLIHRALFVFRDLLCESVPEPPDGATDAQPGDPTDSERMQSESRAADGSCGACHRTVDPYAYALEPFGFGGAYRELDDFGNATRTDGTLIDQDGEAHGFATPAEYAAVLHDDPRINPCILQRIVRYAWGRRLTADDACDLAQIQARFEELGQTYEAALVAVVEHPSFARK